MQGASGSGDNDGGENREEQEPTPGPSRRRVPLSRRTLTHSRSAEDVRAELRNVSSRRGHIRNVSSRRGLIRNRFFRRLRVSRSRSVDRFRQLVEEYGADPQCASFTSLRLALLNDPEASDLMGDTDVHELMQLIEQEIAQAALEEQGEQHEEADKRETDDIVERHLHPCRVCQQLCPDEGDICAQCQENLREDMEQP